MSHPFASRMIVHPPRVSLVIVLGVLIGAFPLAAGTTPPARPAPTGEASMAPAPVALDKSLMRVHATGQSWDYLRPWMKKQPFTRRGLGVVVGENRILVTAELVLHHTYVEFERPASGERMAAKVESIDYESNLALLSATDPAFLDGAAALPLSDTLRVGEAVDILQLEPNGNVAETSMRLTTVMIGGYLLEDVGLLIYRLTGPIQQRDGSFVIPAVRNGALVGLVMRYDGRNQTADVIPPVIIRRFLDEVAQPASRAFPRAGVGFAPLRDPQLRNYAGAEEGRGVLLTRISPGGPAEKAGLQRGDILLSVGGREIDPDGNFNHPDYGRLPLSYLITTEALAGEEIPVKILREGKELEIALVPERRDPRRAGVPPHQFEQTPEFVSGGGLIFQELSRPYLLEWGPDWRTNAPQRLVYHDAFQEELLSPGEKVVVLTQVIPTPATLGYERMNNTIVTAINGREIRSLVDVREALADPLVPIHRIEISDEPRVIFLDRKAAEEANGILRQRYGIPLP